MCYMCENGKCQRDCYYRVGHDCKYDGFETTDEHPQCDPEDCEKCKAKFKNIQLMVDYQLMVDEQISEGVGFWKQKVLRNE